MKKCLPIFIFLSVLFWHSGLLAGTTGKIEGIVKDAETGHPLFGANVMLRGTAIGASSNMKGEYRLDIIPPGEYTLIATFIGYKQAEFDVSVRVDETISMNIDMEFDVVEGKTIVITAQVEGQVAAINRQIASNTIVNVVSSDKIKELPDQNAAESLGRLPGISTQRDAGEGTKIIVRGLSPRFNSITINGERIPSTDEQDRSVDLSMISPDVLAGIEVFKALTPDKDGDAVGGTVNFTVKKASEKFRADMRLQGGYNAHEADFGQYKGSASLSNRYFNNKLGLVVTGSLQRANRSSDLLNASYTFTREQREGEEQAVVSVNNLNLIDRIETRDRYSASLALDYDLKHGDILFNSFFGRTERDEVRRRKRYRLGAWRTEYDLRNRQVNTNLWTNMLAGHHDILGMELDWRTSYSSTKQVTPFSHFSVFRELAAFTADIIDDQGPELIPEGAYNHLHETFYKSSNLDSSLVKDADYTAQMDLKLPFTLGENIAGYLKLGGKFRGKTRSRDNTRWWSGHFGLNDLGAFLGPDVWDLTDENKIAISNFIGDFVPRDYLNGQYDFGPGLDAAALDAFADAYMGYVMPDGSRLYIIDPTYDLEDYDAGEEIIAAYAMTEINLSRYLMILPGIRYERTTNDYKSLWGNPYGGDGEPVNIGSLTDSTGGQNYAEWLPMVHLRFKPARWVDLRLAVTRTLSRPNYFYLVPWRRILHQEGTIEQGNPALKHTTVWNYDAFLSFYNRLGMFTLGGFYKKLWNIDYERESRLQGGDFNGYMLTEPVNAETPSTVYGIEIELQTNLRDLPSPFDGIVLYANLSMIHSETFFPFFEIGPRSPDPPYRPTIIDTVRSGPMPGQADFIGNFTVGYEKGGFSGRVSMVYQGKSLRFVGTREELDGYENAFLRWDLAVQQKLLGGMSLFMNINNLTNRPEGAFLGIEAFPTHEEYFGWSGDFGIRYTFK